MVRGGVVTLVMGLWLAGAGGPVAHARDTQVSAVINGFSYHLPRESYYNERNIGFGAQFDQGWGAHHMMLGLGTYRDSYHTQANYTGAGYFFRNGGRERLGERWFVDTGVVLLFAKSDGYTKYYHVPLLIAPLPWVAVGNERVALNMMFAPAPNDHYASVLTMQLKLVMF